jgi:hypothetical protein
MATASESQIFGVGGGGGGGGGGALQITVRGTIEIGTSGRLSARGGQGNVGRGKPLANSGAARTRGDWGGACGGGGSGGAILLQATQSVTVGFGAELDVSGGPGGRPGDTTDERYLSSEKYPMGGEGGWGRIRIEAPQAATEGALLKPEGIVPSTNTVFTGAEVYSVVWSKPIPFRLGPGDGLMMTDSTVLEGGIEVIPVNDDFTSPAVRWRLLWDGSEARYDTGPARFFGPQDNFVGLLEGGYKPSLVRFMIAFVGSSETGEAPEIDRVAIPWEPVTP